MSKARQQRQGQSGNGSIDRQDISKVAMFPYTGIKLENFKNFNSILFVCTGPGKPFLFLWLSKQIGHCTFKKCEGRLADLKRPIRFKLISRLRLLCPQLFCSRWIASICLFLHTSGFSTILWHEQNHQQLTSQKYHNY